MKRPLARYFGLWVLSAALAAGIWWFGAPEAAADAPPEPASNGLCLACHEKPGLTIEIDGQERALAAIDQAVFTESAHGRQTCIECHAGQSVLPHAPVADVAPSGGRVPTCIECHGEAYDGYLESPHGTMAELRDSTGPTCTECHGNAHAVQPISEWTKEERTAICGRCHAGANTRLLSALSHEAPSLRFRPTVYFAGRFLVVLASASLAFGIIHVELDLLRWIAQHRRAARRERWQSH